MSKNEKNRVDHQMDIENVRAEIIIHGRVQKVGYKDLVDEIAFNLNINGNVKNLDDGTVQIICEGKKDDIKELTKKIDVRHYPIRIEKIDVEYASPTGEFKMFEIIREEGLTKATYEIIDSAARYMREMNSNLGNKIDSGFNSLGNKIDNGFGKMDDNFADMDVKYRLISEGMFAIVNELKETNKILGEKLEKTDKNIEELLKFLVRQNK